MDLNQLMTKLPNYLQRNVDLILLNSTITYLQLFSY